MLATRFLSALIVYTTRVAGLRLAWDSRPNAPWNSDDTMSKVYNAVKRTNFAATTADLAFSHNPVKRSHAHIHAINTTLVHSTPVIDGTWSIANASIPADWLCVALFDTSTSAMDNATSDNDTDTRDYACMPQQDFARLYREYGKDNKRYLALVAGLAVVTVLLLATITMAAGVLVWTDNKRRKLEKEGVTYAPGGDFKAGEIAHWKGLAT